MRDKPYCCAESAGQDPHFSYAQAGVVHLGRRIEGATSRCSRADRLAIGEALLSLLHSAKEGPWSILDRRTQHDLRVIVRDQRAHIKNLEAQLLPHLTAPQSEQGVLP